MASCKGTSNKVENPQQPKMNSRHNTCGTQAGREAKQQDRNQTQTCDQNQTQHMRDTGRQPTEHTSAPCARSRSLWSMISTSSGCSSVSARRRYLPTRGVSACANHDRKGQRPAMERRWTVKCGGQKSTRKVMKREDTHTHSLTHTHTHTHTHTPSLERSRLGTKHIGRRMRIKSCGARIVI
jgi:hypothetical protein